MAGHGGLSNSAETNQCVNYLISKLYSVSLCRMINDYWGVVGAANINMYKS